MEMLFGNHNFIIFIYALLLNICEFKTIFLKLFLRKEKKRKNLSAQYVHGSKSLTDVLFQPLFARL